MATHESQSLLMEMQACRTPAFLRYLTPLLQAEFEVAASDPVWTEENLYRHFTHVEKGLVRVDAVEATYPLHVILRYEIERGLISGKWNWPLCLRLGMPRCKPT